LIQSFYLRPINVVSGIKWRYSFRRQQKIFHKICARIGMWAGFQNFTPDRLNRTINPYPEPGRPPLSAPKILAASGQTNVNNTSSKMSKRQSIFCAFCFYRSNKASISVLRQVDASVVQRPKRQDLSTAARRTHDWHHPVCKLRDSSSARA
jgi:hypothetical protein